MTGSSFLLVIILGGCLGVSRLAKDSGNNKELTQHIFDGQNLKKSFPGKI
jgi:hypothetical protein